MNRILHTRRRRIDGVTFASITVIGCLLYIASLALDEEPYTNSSIDFAPASHRWLRSDTDDSNYQPISSSSSSISDSLPQTENTDLQSPVKEPASDNIIVTTDEEKKKTVNVYVTGPFSESLSIFKTDFLQRFGSGRVNYNFREHSRCNTHECVPAPRVAHDEPCLAITKYERPYERRPAHRKTWTCEVDDLRCSYPQCKTMV